MSRVKTFMVTSANNTERQQFLDNMYLIRAEYKLDWPSDAVIFAVDLVSKWVKFARSYAGEVLVAPLADSDEYTSFGDITQAIEVARANALQDGIAYGIWNEDDNQMAILSDRGELFLPSVSPEPYS